MKAFIYTLRMSCVLILSFGMLYSFGRRPVPAVGKSRLAKGTVFLHQNLARQQRPSGPIFRALERLDADLQKPDSLLIPNDKALKTFVTTYISYVLAYVGYGQYRDGQATESQLNAFLAYQLIQSQSWDLATQVTLMELTNRIMESMHRGELRFGQTLPQSRESVVLANQIHGNALNSSIRGIVRGTENEVHFNSAEKMAEWKREAHRNCRMPGV